MVDLNKILHQAFSRPSALTAFNRWLKTLASRGAEGATSALSLAMLVFLVQEARANASVSAESEESVAPEAASLDTIRQLFDAPGRSAGAVAGVEYSDIALAVSQIYAAYEAELAVVEGELVADAADAAGMDQGAEMAVLDGHLQDAGQYAALSLELDMSGGSSDAPVQPAQEESEGRGFLPFLFFGAGVAIASQQPTAAAPVSTNNAPKVSASLAQSVTEGSDSVTLNLLQGASDVDTGDTLSLTGVTYQVGAAAATGTIPAGLSLSDKGVLSVDPTNAAFKGLAKGEFLTIKVSYTITDGKGGTVTQTASITITGEYNYYSSGGYAADGYISGATVFQDLDGNGKWDEGEPKGTTDANGKFAINLVEGSAATLIVTGGTDISTKIAFTGVLKAPPGSSVVTPLTTMIQALIESSGLSLDEAKAVVIKAYSLDDSKDLLNFDPFSLENRDDPATFAFQKANIFIASVMTAGASMLSSAGELSSGEAYLKMASAISSLLDGRFVPAVDGYGYGEYEDAASIKELLVLAAGEAGIQGEALERFNTVSTEASIAIANSTRALVEAVDYDKLLDEQKKAQSTLVEAIEKAVDEGAPDNLTPELQHPIEISGALTFTPDGSAQLNLLQGAQDPDASHVLSLTGLTYKVGDADATGSIPDGLSLSSAGVLTVDPSNAAFKALGQGQTGTIIVSYTITDGEGSTVAQTATITITGTNDAPTVSGSLTPAAAEGVDGYVLNLLQGASDVDGDTLSLTGLTYKVGEADATGVIPAGLRLNESLLTVDPSNAAFKPLGEGQTQTIVVSYNIIDGKGGTVERETTITITGTNDAPTVAAVLSAAATEAASSSVTLDLLSGASDVDATDTSLSLSGVTYQVGTATASSAVPAGLSLSDVGVLTIDPTNAAFNALTADQTQIITVRYSISDGKGGTVAQMATITITGTNDAPTVEAALISSANEAAASYTLDLLSGAGDVDAGETASPAVSGVNYKVNGASVDGIPAGLTLNAGVLTVDPTHATFNSLAAGVTRTITVEYTISDVEGSTVAQTATITITGAAQTAVISLANAQALHSANTFYSDDDNVTVDVTSSAISDAGGLSGLNLKNLGALGVDVMDIDGSATNAPLHIDSAAAKAISIDDMRFAQGDTITLDATAVELATADGDALAYNGTSSGSYLVGSLDSAVSGMSHGLSLSALGALGVDVIDIGGSATSAGNVQLHIDSADALGMSDAGLSFAAGDTITLDVKLESGAYADNGNGNGSHLASSLGAEDNIGGLTLSKLVGLGVDVIDVVGNDGTAGDFTAHISAAESRVAFDAGLVFNSQDDILLRITSEDLVLGSKAAVLADVVNLNIETGVDSVQFADGTAIALSGDQGLVELLMGLTSDDAGEYDLVAGVVVNQSADFTVSDSMVKALLDAGLFTADAASTIKVDATADTEGHVATTLAQLADIGADQVEVAGDVAYIDLGDVDAKALNDLFTSLIDNQTQDLVIGANGDAVSTGLLLTSEQEAALASIIEDKAAELSDMGIDKVYVADVDGTDLTLGLEHFRELQLNQAT